MPIESIEALDGDPTQSGGVWSGSVTVTLTDGRKLSHSFSAPTEAEWLIAKDTTVGPIVLAQVKAQDAEAAVDVNAAIAASGEASAEEVGYQYFIAAYANDDPYQAYLLFDEYGRWAKNDMGWNNDSQMLAGMAGTGLTQEEWEFKVGTPANPGLDWISDPGQVNKMEAVQETNATWVARAQF